MDAGARVAAESGWTRLRACLWNKNVRFWYLGASFGLLYQVPVLVMLWSAPEALVTKVTTTVLLSLVYLAFLVLPPLLWGTTARTRLVAVCGYWAFTLLLVPGQGPDVVWLWIFVAAVAGVTIERARVLYGLLGGILVLQAVVITATRADLYLYISVLVTASLGSVMFAMSRQLGSVRRLREANSEIARLAVVEERTRFARDLHDVLGHSLTVVTVKSELAQRLVDIDPTRARAELADIERLSRDALTDLRAAVSNYREVSLETELVSAGRALAAAGIQAHLPDTALGVPAETASFFAWALREGVTNVIRHSGATGCWVQLDPQRLTVADDGHGVLVPATAAERRLPGNGLRGLRERAGAAGARLDTGVSEHGGFLLVATGASA